MKIIQISSIREEAIDMGSGEFITMIYGLGDDNLIYKWMGAEDGWLIDN